MALTRIAQSASFMKRRSEFPSLARFFRTPGEGRGLGRVPFRFAVTGLLSLRETPVSGIAFKYWFLAYAQRLSGRPVESLLPCERCYRKLGPDGFPFLTEDTFRDILGRRRWYILGGETDLAQDCARMAAVEAVCEMKELRRPGSFREDVFKRMADDVNQMAAGLYERLEDPYWSFSGVREVLSPLGYGGAFGYPDAAADLVADGAMFEVKPVRTVAAERSADQFVAHYLLYAMERPDADIRELRFYLPRHAAICTASLRELEEGVSLRGFGDWLFASEEIRLIRLRDESFEAFRERKFEAAMGRAWEVSDQNVMLGRRIERAGRIGITTLAEIREVAPVLDEEIRQKLDRVGDEDLSPHLRDLLKSMRLDEIWECEHEQQRADARIALANWEIAAERWREYSSRRWSRHHSEFRA